MDRDEEHKILQKIYREKSKKIAELEDENKLLRRMGREMDVVYEATKRDVDFRQGKINFRDSQLRDERDENRKLRAELKEIREIDKLQGRG